MNLRRYCRLIYYMNFPCEFKEKNVEKEKDERAIKN